MNKLKIFLLVVLCACFLCGCSNDSEDEIVKNIKKNLKDMSSYQVEGNLTIYNDNNQYDYNVNVFYEEDEKYRVNLTNVLNNHEQIILKNSNEVYVITPSLNKSFKFQSSWPKDSSQIYLIESLYEDIFISENRMFEKVDSGYVFKIEANYPNNSNLVKQTIEFDNNLKLINVKVYDDNDVLQMNMDFKNIVINENIDDDVFDLDAIIKGTDVNSNAKEVSSIDDIIYPLYIPNGTVLIEEEKVSKDDGERIILTFDGEKPFILVEETISVGDDFSIIPTFGEPFFMFDSVATLSDNSISWISDGIEYYLISDVMSQIELIEIASSVTTIEYDK